jgi:hypothetical protein
MQEQQCLKRMHSAHTSTLEKANGPCGRSIFGVACSNFEDLKCIIFSTCVVYPCLP